jgi:hypothetical protein
MRVSPFSLLVVVVFALSQALVGCSGCSSDPDPDPDVGDATTGDGSDVDPPDAEIACRVRLADGFTDFGPPNELTLTADDEPTEYLNSGGLQFDFRATTRNIDQGQPVTLFINGAQVGAAASVVMAQGSDGISDFANITLSAGEHEIYLDVQTLDGDTLRCEPTTFNVEAAAGQCDVQLLPTAEECLQEDANLNQDGIQQSFVVSNPNGECDTARLRYTIGNVELNTNTKALENGQATFTITIGQEPLNGQKIVVSGVVFKSADPEGSVVESAPPTTFIADSVTPELAITSPLNTQLGLNDDADPEAPGVQITLAGVASGVAADDDIVIEYAGTEIVVQPSGQGPEYNWQATLDFQESGVYEVTVSSTDECGNKGMTNVELTISITASSLMISAPSNGGTLAAKDDDDPQTETLYETDFVVTASGVVTPVTFTVKCGKNVEGELISDCKL